MLTVAKSNPENSGLLLAGNVSTHYNYSMRTCICVFSLILFSLTSVFGTNNQIVIEGQILNYDGKKEVKYSISPFLAYSIMDKSVQPDSLGRFSITSSIDKIHFFWMYYRQKKVMHRCQLILKPGCNYSFVSIGDTLRTGRSYSPIIKGCFEEGQIQFNLIDNGYRGSVFDDYWNLDYPENLIDTLIHRIERRKSIFEDLLDRGQIDMAFYDVSALNIEFIKAYQLAITINHTIKSMNIGKSEPEKLEELKKVYSEIFEEYPIQGRSMEYTLIFGDYIWLYLAHLGQKNLEKFEEYKAKGLGMTFSLNNAKKNLSDDAYQIFALQSILNYSTKLDKEAQMLFENFKKEYPNTFAKNTFYYKLLEFKYIPKIVELYKLSNKTLPSGVTILDEEKPISSFHSLVELLNGQPFFIDCWATWCGPCRYDFQFNAPLKTFLKENNIKMVYIAFEKSRDREKWLNFIKSYNLKGSHFISNSAFKSDLKRMVNNIDFGLPRYIIVNSNGEIVEKNAYRPSDKEKLFRQIMKKLNL